MKLLGAHRIQELPLRLETALPAALAAEAEALAASVRDGLAEPPGGPHERPWRRTGALAESVGSTSAGLSAVVGSNDPAAVPQENGTARVPPRPFFAPVAAERAAALARAVGARLFAAL